MGEGGRWWGGYSLLFQPICLAISLQWAVFLLLWLLKDSGSVSGWCRFYLEFHVLFSLLQCFCSFESEVEVRLLSVHFLLLLILCLLCVCVCVGVRFFRDGMLSFLNVRDKSDTFHGILHFGYFCSNFITH